MSRLVDHGYIAATLVFTVYSQLIMRWQVAEAGLIPVNLSGKVFYILNLLLNPWVLSGIASTFYHRLTQ